MFARNILLPLQRPLVNRIILSLRETFFYTHELLYYFIAISSYKFRAYARAFLTRDVRCLRVRVEPLQCPAMH